MKIPLLALPHKATIIPFIGSGAYGPKWDETNVQVVRCYIEVKTKQTTNTTGTDVTKKADGTFPPNAKIKANDKVVWDGVEYKVTEIHPVYIMGLHSIEVGMI